MVNSWTLPCVQSDISVTKVKLMAHTNLSNGFFWSMQIWDPIHWLQQKIVRVRCFLHLSSLNRDLRHACYYLPFLMGFPILRRIVDVIWVVRIQYLQYISSSIKSNFKILQEKYQSQCRATKTRSKLHISDMLFLLLRLSHT